MRKRFDYVQFQMRNDIASISYDHSPTPTPMFALLSLVLNAADAGKLCPEVDPNGNCGVGEKVSLLWFVFPLSAITI